MDKEILTQYTDLQQEIEDLQRRIYHKEAEIEKMEAAGHTVKDSVKGTRADGTIGSIVIEGFPNEEYERKKSLLRTSRLHMKLKCEKLMELTNKVEQYINEMQDSRMRRIFRYRYLDNMNWMQVAHWMGGNATADSCRVAHDRFLKEK